MTKEQVIDLLKALPEPFELEDLFERMLFVQQLEERMAQSDSNQVVSFEEARQRLTQPKQRTA